MRARTLALACATVLLGLACDAPTARPDAKSAEREAEVEVHEEVPAAPAARADAEPTRDLAQLERELNGNEIKLRELGVAIAGPAFDGEPGKAESKDKKSGATKTATKKVEPDKRTSSAGGMAPGSSPRPASPELDDAIAGDADSRDEAKSIQNPPTDRPTERPSESIEEVCPLICSLADSTCELTDEICELADRHVDDDTYSLACERAANDCKLAREACLECPR